MTNLNVVAQDLGSLILNEFDRLSVSTNSDACSGLSVNTTDQNVVCIYDDYASGNYEAQPLLCYLKELSIEDVSLASDSLNNIWQHIAEFEQR